MTIFNKKRKDETGGNDDFPSSKANLPDGWTRTTLVVREDLLEKLKVIAWYERTTIKKLMEEILEEALASKNLEAILEEKKKMEERKAKFFP